MRKSPTMEIPLGFRFAPTNIEIITNYLKPKIQGLNIHGDWIVEQDIYSTNPDSLNWNKVPYLFDNERYFFVKRTPMSSKEANKNTKTKRTVNSGEGFWHLSKVYPVFDHRNRAIIAKSSLLNFYLYRDYYSEKSRDSAVKTEFIMYEFSLIESRFQEWVVCRIKKKGDKKVTKMASFYEMFYREMVKSANQIISERLNTVGTVINIHATINFNEQINDEPSGEDRKAVIENSHSNNNDHLIWYY